VSIHKIKKVKAIQPNTCSIIEIAVLEHYKGAVEKIITISYVTTIGYLYVL